MAITANAGVSTTTLTTSDNIVVGAGKKIFVDRSALANNKLVLWDGGTGSTTAFFGFGIANNTLIYNVNTSSDGHIFYYGAANELFRINNTEVKSTFNNSSREFITMYRVNTNSNGLEFSAINQSSSASGNGPKFNGTITFLNNDNAGVSTFIIRGAYNRAIEMYFHSYAGKYCYFRSDSDDQFALGQSGYKWTAVWATNGTIQPSDKNLYYR